jgi:hypothetical protein
MIITTITLRCDTCGVMLRGPGSRGVTGAQVRSVALARGWQIQASGGRDYCPEHRHAPGSHHA